ncbi:MAG: hypothetical protein ACFFF4_16895 [Candidatus Thorarchaeota archaeon]
MQKLNGTTILRIPEGLLIEDLLDSLEVGHGYVWTRLVVSPKIWIYGSPPSSELPELLIIGRNILLEDNESLSQSFSRMLQALSHRSQVLGGRHRE